MMTFLRDTLKEADGDRSHHHRTPSRLGGAGWGWSRVSGRHRLFGDSERRLGLEPGDALCFREASRSKRSVGCRKRTPHAASPAEWDAAVLALGADGRFTVEYMTQQRQLMRDSQIARQALLRNAERQRRFRFGADGGPSVDTRGREHCGR